GLRRRAPLRLGGARPRGGAGPGAGGQPAAGVRIILYGRRGAGPARRGRVAMQGEGMSGDRLKQRLTGGIALLLLGVIAWFWLLGADSPVDPVARETRIPPAPPIERFEVAEPRQPEGI